MTEEQKENLTTAWYDLSDMERAKNVYGKYTTKDFWDWWSSRKPSVMEVRIKNFPFVKMMGRKLDLPISASGLYVDNAEKLLTVIKEVRNHEKCWFGVNPRKQNYNKKFGWFSFGGSDDHIQEIRHLFFDIDRVDKDGAAKPYDLKNAHLMAKELLKEFAKNGWDKSYCLICSGNGVQLIVKLDEPILMPTRTFHMDTKQYEHNVEFEKLKKVIRDGIGKRATAFSSHFRDAYNCEVDPLALNIGRVAALPATKNFKYDGFTWRGIIEMKDGINEGLSDFILSKFKDIKVYNSVPLMKDVPLEKISILKKFEPGKFKEHYVFQTMRNMQPINEKLPKGMVNNYWWNGIKLLLCASGWVDDKTLDIKQEYMAEFTEVWEEMKVITGRDLPKNFERNMFNANANYIMETINGTWYLNATAYPPFPPLHMYNVDVSEKLYIHIPTFEELENVTPGGLSQRDPQSDVKDIGDKIFEIRKGEHDKDIWKGIDKDLLIVFRNKMIKSELRKFLAGFINKYGENHFRFFTHIEYFEKCINKRLKAINLDS